MTLVRYPPVEVHTRAIERICVGHPWVFKHGLARGLRVEPGAAVTLVDAFQRPLAIGLAQPGSDLAVRVLGTPDACVDEVFFRHRLESAASDRKRWGVLDHTNAWRWVHGENDRLPGFVLDVYGSYVVCKLDGPFERWLPVLATAMQNSTRLQDEFGLAAGLLLRSEVPHMVLGSVPQRISVEEHGIGMIVDVWQGQKTGLFLDQRENRHWVRSQAMGRSVLNLFSYTGGFSLAALAGGAHHVTSVDLARPALAMIEASLALNGLDTKRHWGVAEDCSAFLQRAASKDRRWDLVILDPPSLAHRQTQLHSARQAYERINRLAMRVLAPGGLLCTASCTSRITEDEFLMIVRRAAEREGRMFRVIRQAGAGADHPVLLSFPEGRYLKFLALQDTP